MVLGLIPKFSDLLQVTYSKTRKPPTFAKFMPLSAITIGGGTGGDPLYHRKQTGKGFDTHALSLVLTFRHSFLGLGFSLCPASDGSRTRCDVMAV